MSVTACPRVEGLTQEHFPTIIEHAQQVGGTAVVFAGIALEHHDILGALVDECVRVDLGKEEYQQKVSLVFENLEWDLSGLDSQQPTGITNWPSAHKKVSRTTFDVIEPRKGKKWHIDFVKAKIGEIWLPYGWSVSFNLGETADFYVSSQQGAYKLPRSFTPETRHSLIDMIACKDSPANYVHAQLLPGDVIVRIQPTPHMVKIPKRKIARKAITVTREDLIAD